VCLLARPRRPRKRPPDAVAARIMANWRTTLKLRAICFDLDNTFWDVVPVLDRAERELHGWLATHCPGAVSADDFGTVRRERELVAADHPARSHDVSFLRHEALRRCVVAAGHPVALATEAYEVFIAARNRVEPFADVVPALGRLGRRYRLFTLTNGNADLTRIGLDAHFEIRLAAADVGCAKPDTRIFAALLACAGLKPSEVLHVGDEPLTDVVGAHGAGMPAAWVNRRGDEWPAELMPPRYTVSDLGGLADALLRSPAL
jgi:FMN hydrolase / 5-amino-6-(5-phospho-D-ribitylamino)uracil phosphatase